MHYDTNCVIACLHQRVRQDTRSRCSNLVSRYMLALFCTCTCVCTQQYVLPAMHNLSSGVTMSQSFGLWRTKFDIRVTAVA